MITNDPRVSREHLIALAQKCDLLTGYRTQEMVDALVGFAYVVLNDKAVQEAFVRANPRPVLDTLTQEISAMKHHCVEARQALDINDFAHCAYEIDAALKVGAGETAQPAAWIRFCSDGTYEGPIADCDSRMDATRRTSGAWTPLYPPHNVVIQGPPAGGPAGMESSTP